MAAAFVHWPPTQGNLGEPASSPIQLLPIDPEPAAEKPKPQQARKQASRKKPKAQRGPGVAQLERLRLQKRLHRLVDSHPPPSSPPSQIEPAPASTIQVRIPAVYEHGPAVSYGTPVAYGGSWRYGGGGEEGVSAVRSVIYDQRLLDRMWMSAGMVGSELPSTQRMQCLSDHCELCSTKKRLFLFWGTQSIADHFAMPVDPGLEAVGNQSGMKGKPVKEYDFFPQYNGSTADGDDHPGPVDPTVVVASSTYFPATANFLDLTLKL